MRTPIMLLAVVALLFCAPAFAEVTTNISQPTTVTVFIPCANGGAGETATLTGDLHILISTTINDNNVHLTSHFQPQGLSGTGSVTGDKYQGTGVTRQDINQNVAGFPANLTFVNNFRIIGQGPGNNYLVHQVVHVTVNADGTVTADFNKASVECK